ncbi:MAG: DEAD/DEAH box helicase [Candidatus Riflebacteria bacterium]|nr:DEAD/DEAH box helicase [Candidatus Riflebacteria bacterium]
MTSPFSALNLHPDIQRAISTLGFQTPTPIQESAIPPALRGQDVLACAMTGSGKTAAFALPIIHRLLETKRDSKRNLTRALILAPTRELAAQIRDHIGDLTRFTTIRSAAIFGGVSMGNQRDAMMRGVEILVATPGRLLDHFSQDYGQIPGLEYLVLDEADRMLDMGFLPDIRRVLRHLPRTSRQTLFFSATLPEPIVELSQEMLNKPYMINIDRPASTADGIVQSVYPVPDTLKSRLLLHILESGEIKNALVFARTKHRANRLSDFLDRNGVSCDRIHGNRSQAQRTSALQNFRDGSCRVLVATDIAARGIDVEGISHVINFDIPHIPDDYIHRVGRTARAKRCGTAISLVSSMEEYDLKQIEKHLKKQITRVRAENFDYTDRATEQLEIPLAQRLAAHRAKRAQARGHTTDRPITRSTSTVRRATAIGNPTEINRSGPKPQQRSGQRTSQRYDQRRDQRSYQKDDYGRSARS